MILMNTLHEQMLEAFNKKSKPTGGTVGLRGGRSHAHPRYSRDNIKGAQFHLQVGPPVSKGAR